jgi:aminopeptidase
VDASTRTSPSPVESATLARYADLLVGLGANVQDGQIVEVRSELELAPLVRAIADAAYRRGARFVDARYFDPYVRRSRIVHAAEETLDFAPSWDRERVRELGKQRCARISLAPLVPPGVFDDLDPVRSAREPYPSLPEMTELVMEQTTNWTAAPGPTAEWARQVYPEVDSPDALARLWDDVVHVCRLDDDDPERAWRERFAELAEVTHRLNEADFDALRFEGPGTNLTVGLLPTSRWKSGTGETIDGIEHAPNLPTEETFTAPDPARTDGVVRATRPLLLRGGTVVRDLVVRFQEGRAVDVDAASGGEALRELLGRDEGASRLGEVALVDREGRVGRTNTVFWMTLLDENAASHIALGRAYPDSVDDEDRARANRSEIHEDFMIGGDDVAVTAITRDGREVALLRGGTWQI